jgi:anti-sigma-K factor RskA
MTAHETYEDALAAYALDALDEAERTSFEAHLATCLACRRELAALRQVAAGLADGTDVERVPPPAHLRARTIAHATDRVAGRPAAPRPGGWLAAVAASVIAVGFGVYAWQLRAEVRTLEDLVTRASERLETMRAELVDLRRDSETLVRTVNILGAPDVLKVNLEGQAGAPAAQGVAYWSASGGLLVSAAGLPTLTADRVYQLWVIPPGAGSAPVSAGFLTVAPAGAATFAASSPVIRTRPAAIAISVEPAGGSPGPTTDPVLAGAG